MTEKEVARIERLRESAFDKFIKKFSKKVGDKFDYVSGYINCESMIEMRCRDCGGISFRCSSFIRKNKVLSCDVCGENRRAEMKRRDESKKIKQLTNKIAALLKNRIAAMIRSGFVHQAVCKGCNKSFVTNYAVSIHCNECIESIKQRRTQSRKNWEHKVVRCAECGNEFYMKGPKSKYCSRLCYKRGSRKDAHVRKRYKLKSNGNIDCSISIDNIIKRDGLCCHICGDECNRNDYWIDSNGTFIAGNYYPSIDHLIPVSKGGTHTQDNVMLAHRGCNSAKSDLLCYGGAGQQMQLAM